VRYDFDQVIERRNTESVKWDSVKNLFGSEDVLPLFVADMDFASPAPVIEAVAKRAQHPVYGYTKVPAGLIEAIVQRLDRRFGWKIDPSWIIFTPDVVSAVNASVRGFTKPGEKVIVQSPAYPPFWSSVTNSAARSVANELKLVNGRYEIDWEALEKDFSDPEVQAMILCSPHNPVGRVWSPEELTRIGELAAKARVPVISDEIHCELVYKGHHHHPFASLSEESLMNSVTCMAPSKTFNLAGLHAAFAIIPNESLRAKFNEARAGIMGGVGLFGHIAMEAAFRYGDEWLEQVMDYIEANRDFAIRYFKENIPAIVPIKPEGTYLMWLDCRKLGLGPAELRKFFNTQAKVGLNDGPSFGVGGEGFQRINLGCRRAVLEEALKRIEAAVKAL
jgi:cystathionine beta-lyase